MDKKPDLWDIPLMPKKRSLPDEDLEGSDDNFGSERGDNPPGSGQRPPVLKLISLITAVVFTALVLGNWLQLFDIPSLDFLSESTELAHNQKIKKLQEAVVTVKTPGQKGTGFNIDPQGLIITNNHVIQEARVINVQFPDGAGFPGKERVGFPELDLAIIKIAGKDLPVVKLESEFTPKAGDELLIIGNPLGFSGVVNKVKVTGKARLKNWEEPVIMIRGPIHKGNSGSPVFNSEGNVVAVVFAALPPEENGNQEETTGLAVPVSQLMKLLN